MDPAQSVPDDRPAAPAADDIPPFIRTLAEGKSETIDFDVPLSDRPPWFDEDRFKRGQKFASEHLFGVVYCEMLSLLMLFALRPILTVLISTGRSSTPQRAFRRYLGTAQKVISWYEEDVWCSGQAKTNMAIVRGLHKGVFNRLQEDAAAVGEAEGAPAATETLLLDFRDSCEGNPAYDYLMNTEGVVWLSQLDMALTQFGFVGLAVTYPKLFGIHNTTDEDLADFVHMWRTLGYLLGIKDRYNFCNADLPTVQQRSRDLINAVVKPALREVDGEWEHMSRCMIAGIGLHDSKRSFDSSILFLCHVLDISTPRFRKSVSYKQFYSFYIRRFLFFLARIRSVSNYFNHEFKNEMKRMERLSLEVAA